MDPLIIAAIITVVGAGTVHIILKIIDLVSNIKSRNRKELLELTDKIFSAAKEIKKEHEESLVHLLKEYLVDITYVMQIDWNVPEIYHLCRREAKRAISYNKTNLNPTEFLPDIYTNLPRVYIQILPDTCSEEDLLYAETCKLFLRSLLEEPNSLLVRSCAIVVMPLVEFTKRGLYMDLDPDVLDINLLREGFILPDQSIQINIVKLKKKLGLLEDLKKYSASKVECKEKIKEEMWKDAEDYIESKSNEMVEKAFKPYLKPFLKRIKNVIFEKVSNIK